jgi:hypothetical protein
VTMNSVLSLTGAAPGIAARIPQLKSAPVSDKTHWANPLPPQPWHGTVPADNRQLATLDQLAASPEEEIWLAKQKSKQTRRAYRLDVRHFMRALGITTTAALRQVDHRAVIAWERMQWTVLLPRNLANDGDKEE